MSCDPHCPVSQSQRVLVSALFLGELEKINWPQIVDHDTTADPLITYEQQFSTKLDKVINTHFPLKVVKFNKHKHKKCKWMTHTLLTEIKKEMNFTDLSTPRNQKSTIIL